MKMWTMGKVTPQPLILGQFLTLKPPLKSKLYPLITYLLFQQFLNLSSSQRDMSGPILGDLSNNR